MSEQFNFDISLAQKEDMMDLFQLANDKVVRQNSFNQNEILLDEHIHWFDRILKDDNCYFYVIKDGTNLVGSVRFNRSQEKEFVIGIQISEPYRGKGLGPKIIKLTTKKLLNLQAGCIVKAYIKEENQASLKAFIGADYKLIGHGLKDNSPCYILNYNL